MANEIVDKCCCDDKTALTYEVKDNDLCPVCKESGIKVENFTVKHLVMDTLVELVNDTDYYLCMNEECDIVYYDKKTGVNFNRQQVKVPIWFKKEANPKYVCYCSKVTEEQVINAILIDGANNMKDVLKLTGAMKNAQCQKNNPLGKCCHQIIQDAIDKGLSMK
ncbi:BFD-like [2Fe-2S] binding protein [Gottschalkia purinilytica]|uniref:BFD-like [2Fe-2S] binding protein n=1 Tax=Gottschalkia purinilytica TaxID=1503 RepID=A0A0L0WC98_GOTPU|nr:(2Fe-2S)-binding protein [Gottschalkia purinilytica]KNF09091.1 BFD-like [2Fe-2S] binding protein [Gottschalkia purinilytica]